MLGPNVSISLCIIFISLFLVVEVTVQVESSFLCCSLLLSSPLSFAQLKTPAPLGKDRDGVRETTAAFLEWNLLNKWEHRGVVVTLPRQPVSPVWVFLSIPTASLLPWSSTSIARWEAPCSQTNLDFNCSRGPSSY